MAAEALIAETIMEEADEGKPRGESPELESKRSTGHSSLAVLIDLSYVLI